MTHCDGALPVISSLYMTSGDNVRPRLWDWVVSARQSGNRAVLPPLRASVVPASSGTGKLELLAHFALMSYAVTVSWLRT